MNALNGSIGGGTIQGTPMGSRTGYWNPFKAAKKAVSKVVDVGKQVIKSPVGKAALIGLGGAGLMGAGPLGTMLGGVGSKMGLTGLGGRISPFLFGAKGISGVPGQIGKYATPGILGKLGAIAKSPLGMIGGASLVTYFMQKGKTEEEAEDLAQDVYRGKGLGLDLIKADIKKYRTGALSGSQMFDKGYHFLTPRNYIGAAGGRVGLKGGGADWINTHKPGPMGNPAVMEKIENMREWRIANPDVEDVADYKSYYEKLKKKKKKKEKKAEGGRIGLYAGGNGTPLPEDPTKPINPWAPRPKEGIKSLEAGASSIKVEGDVRPENMKMARRLNVDNMSRRTLVKHLNNMELPETNASDFDDNHIRQILIDFAPDMFFGSWGSNMAEGGRIGKLGGGLPRIPMGMPRVNAGGIRELDYRQSGGFVPMGVKEKADDVPAMLSKNEFVMTADAVKGAGGGSVEKGAQRMYDTMKRLEGRVV